MFCPKCGKTLPDDASFCLKCGAPQRQKGKAVAADPGWETSEVHANKLSDGNATTQWQFVVEADGPEGKRMLFASRAFASTSIDLASGTEGTGYKEEMDQLFRTLTSDGWEPLPRGKNWFSYRFRRRVR